MTDDINFESFSNDEGSISESNLEFLAKQGQLLSSLKSEAAELEDKLRDVKEQIRHATEEVIPNYMRELGISELKLKNGAKVKVEDKVFASIPKDVKTDALRWLDDNGFSSLIRHEIKCNFRRGEDERAKRLAEILHEAGYEFKDVEDVHYQTLKAFVKEQLEQGNMLPEDLFSVHVVPTATIK